MTICFSLLIAWRGKGKAKSIKAKKPPPKELCTHTCKHKIDQTLCGTLLSCVRQYQFSLSFGSCFCFLFFFLFVNVMLVHVHSTINYLICETQIFGQHADLPPVMSIQYHQTLE